MMKTDDDGEDPKKNNKIQKKILRCRASGGVLGMVVVRAASITGTLHCAGICASAEDL